MTKEQEKQLKEMSIEEMNQITIKSMVSAENAEYQGKINAENGHLLSICKEGGEVVGQINQRS